MINGIVRQLEKEGDADIPTERIGENRVMEGLKGLDDVAYARFASVYGNFREVCATPMPIRRRAGRARREPSRKASRPLESCEPGGRARRRDERRARRRRTLDARRAALRPPQLRPHRAQPVCRGAHRPRRNRRWPRRARPGGRPHAEVVALAQAGEAARGAATSMLMSSHARTSARRRRAPRRSLPPARRASVAALEDADVRVAGRGFARLREAGIAVALGVGAAAGAARPSRPYSARHRRPAMATLKLAMTADWLRRRR